MILVNAHRPPKQRTKQWEENQKYRAIFFGFFIYLLFLFFPLPVREDV